MPGRNHGAVIPRGDAKAAAELGAAVEAEGHGNGKAARGGLDFAEIAEGGIEGAAESVEDNLEGLGALPVGSGIVLRARHGGRTVDMGGAENEMSAREALAAALFDLGGAGDHGEELVHDAEDGGFVRLLQNEDLEGEVFENAADGEKSAHAIDGDFVPCLGRDDGGTDPEFHDFPPSWAAARAQRTRVLFATGDGGERGLGVGAEIFRERLDGTLADVKVRIVESAPGGVGKRGRGDGG